MYEDDVSTEEYSSWSEGQQIEFDNGTFATYTCVKCNRSKLWEC